MDQILEEHTQIAYHSDVVRSEISHTSTTFSLTSRLSAPVPKSQSNQSFLDKTFHHERDAQSDVGGAPQNCGKMRKIHKGDQKKFKGSRFNLGVAKFSRSKSQVSSIVPSSNGSSNMSNSGALLPLPIKSKLKNPADGKRENGYIMARTSRMSLILRRWDENCYWTRHNKVCILIFNSKQEFSYWKKLSDVGDKKARCYVRAEFDFNVKRSKTSSNSVVPELKKYWMGDIKPKSYPANNGFVHQFKIEKSTHSGTNIVAAFASTRPHDLNLIRKAIIKCMKRGGMKDKVQKIKLSRDTNTYYNGSNIHPLDGNKDRLVTTMYRFDIDDCSSLASAQVRSGSFRSNTPTMA